MSKKEKTKTNMLNYDADGNVIPAFPVDPRTKRDAKKSSVGFSAVAAILQILAFLPLVICPIFFAVEAYELAPNYSFWHFIGVILAGVLGLVFMAIALTVQRKKSKSSIRTQTVKVLIAFVCLTSVFGVVFTYVLPDLINMATQATIRTEALLYNAETQLETNLSLERQFIRSNILNGTLADHKYAYADLEAHEEENGTIIRYKNEYINTRWNEYKSMSIQALDEIIEELKEEKLKQELYDFIYEQYILTDYDYAFKWALNTGMNDTRERKALAVAMVDYIYEEDIYENYMKEGFGDGLFTKTEARQLFDANFDNFNQDGYLTFDDPLLLFAQLGPRMTVPVIMRLILDNTFQYTQPSYREDGTKYYEEDGNFLFEMYDSETKALYDAMGGTYTEQGKLFNGTEMKYGYYNNTSDPDDIRNGWMVFEDGTVKRPVKWVVLDMDGKPMAITSLDINNLNVAGLELGGILTTVLDSFPEIIDALGGLLTEDLYDVLRYATNGAVLNINLCLNDEGMLEINLLPNNTTYGLLGYMQESWIQSNHLLMAVMQVSSMRNWFYICGAIGSVLVVASGVMRECGKRTRDRSEIAKDRILRAKAAQKHEEQTKAEQETPATA